MKTKLVRPLLVKSKEYVDKYPFLGIDNGKLSIYSERNPSNFNVVIYQLILIGLDSDKKIEVGDEVFANGVDYFGTETQLCTLSEFINKDGIKKIGINHAIKVYKSDYHKVIATQDQLSPNLINQLVAEYNNGGMQDFEIEMEYFENDTSECIGMDGEPNGTPFNGFTPKLTNGFVTVVDTVIGKPLDDYIKEKHSQDRCMGFIDGYNARKLEESISYSEEEIKALINKVIYDTNSNPWLITSKLKISDRWFNENKKR